MKKIITYITEALFILSVGFLGSCKDELIEFENNNGLHGVDRNHVVDIQIPFHAKGGMDEVIVTRTNKANTDMDSQIASLLVLVYEAVDPTKPELNRFIDSHFYETPSEKKASDDNKNGWFPDKDNASQGTLKTKCPVGEVYIYLVANWKNSFIDFASRVSVDDLNNPQRMPQSQKELMEKFIPTWNGNVYRLDGLVPMIATVNNSTGLCTVNHNGEIFYYADGDTEKTHPIKILKDDETFNVDNAFNFKRLMAKVTMNFKVGTDEKGNPKGYFRPRKYTLRNGASHIAPTPNSWPRSIDFYKKLLDGVCDGKTLNFTAQKPDYFEIYVPANLEEPANATSIEKWVDREWMEKDHQGKNLVYSKDEDSLLVGKFKFKNAPKYASYLEISGDFSDGNVTSEGRYFIHLGNFGKNISDFNVHRDYHYTYNVTVNGVNDIMVESEDRENGDKHEVNPGVDGLVYNGGVRAFCDAHYDQVEMRIRKGDFSKDYAVLFTVTPFGSVSLKYYPKGSYDEKEGKTREVGKCESISKLVDTDVETQEQAKKRALGYFGWIEMKGQETKNVFESYPGIQNTDQFTNIFEALDAAWMAPQKEFYYTCFIDEYYYTEHPDPDKKGTKIHLRDFVNKPKRSFALGKDIHISKDGSSVSVDAIWVVYQKAIATFYDLNDDETNNAINKYGVETISETGKFKYYNEKYYPDKLTSEEWDGRANTLAETQSSYSTCVNWAKNGWLITVDELGKEILKDQGVNRLTEGYQKAYLSCMTRNRDLDGNGSLKKDEIRWYNPAINQLLGLWIGQNALPAQASLYNKPLTADIVKNGSNGAIYSSTYGGTPFVGTKRVLWGEEGASFGRENEAETYGGEIRAVRNLGADVPYDGSYKNTPGKFYKLDEINRTIEIYLSENCLRTFSMGELEPHIERSPVNRLHKTFQYADHLLMESRYAYASGQENVKTATTTKAVKYEESQSTIHGVKKVGNWRLPNQRELAVLYMTNTILNKIAPNGTISTGFLSLVRGIHCRTTFTLNTAVYDKLGLGIRKDYTTYGYWYNTSKHKIECADEGESAAYFCVRDYVPN